MKECMSEAYLDAASFVLDLKLEETDAAAGGGGDLA